MARTTVISAFCCPSDTTPIGDEMTSQQYAYYRFNYRGCSGSGDVYGNAISGDAVGYWGIGVFGVKAGQTYDQTRALGARMADIKDGTSNTLLLSEGISPRSTGTVWGGPLGETLYGNMGGALFSTTSTPNSSAADQIFGPCPSTQGDGGYPAPCNSLGVNQTGQPSQTGSYAAARSLHSGGVNAAMADGSVRFFTDTSNLIMWRSLGTRAAGEVVTFQ
jgi:prepilin-type processing-associated H-X9-DG protein